MSSTRVTTFIGRQREQETLLAKLAAARAGQGSLVLLAGEAGIGKTALARTFAEEAQGQGAVVLLGACLEGEWQPPYSPWVEAFTARIRTVDPPQLRQELGPGAAALAQLIPAVQVACPDLPPAAHLRPDEERYRLFDAAAQWLQQITTTTPVVLILDDLHWADSDSLWLLRHVARTASQTALLIVGTYRDTAPDFDRHGTLSDVLAVMRRETDYLRLSLTGLGEAQVIAYLTRPGQEVPLGLARAIHAETGGNPFYLREVFRHLIEEGTIVEHDGRWFTDVSLNALGIPEGVRQVLDRRLARLPAGVTRLLGLAAAFSAGFDFRTLQVLTALPDDALLDALDSALRAGLLRIAVPGPPALYDFAHAIVRHALYDTLNPDRQARLHRQIALALEEVHRGQERTHAAELAAQYHASRALPGGERGVDYALAAAAAARVGYANVRVVSFLRMARDLAEGHPPLVRADLVARLAIAEAETLLLHEARRSADEAVALLITAEASSEPITAFLAQVAQVLKEGGGAPDLWEPLVRRGLTILGATRDLTWARLTLLLNRYLPLVPAAGNIGHWHGLDPDAVAIARTQGDEDDYARTLDPFDWRSPAETAAVLALARTWQRPQAIIRALDAAARDLIYRHGDLQGARECLRALQSASESYGSIPGQSEAISQQAFCETLLGQRDATLVSNRQARELVARLGATHRLQIAELALMSIWSYLFGDDDADLLAIAHRVASDPASRFGPQGLIATNFAALNAFRVGDTALLDQYLALLSEVHPRLDPTTYILSGSLWIVGTVIWERREVSLAARYRQLALHHLAAQIGDGPLNASELTVARMAALVGNHDEARDYFARARRTLDESGHQPMRAIVDYDEALALTYRRAPDESWITALLDAALPRFRALGMGGWERRALALRAQRSADVPASSKSANLLPDGLTPREAEVLRLVAGGQTNREIAEALFLSIPTVQRHIANIYGKIGARGRADATAYALSRGIASPPSP